MALKSNVINFRPRTVAAGVDATPAVVAIIITLAMIGIYLYATNRPTPVTGD